MAVRIIKSEEEGECPRYTKEFLGKLVDMTPLAEVFFSKYCSELPLQSIKKISASSFWKIRFGGKNLFIFGEYHAGKIACLPSRNSAFLDVLVKSVIESHKDRIYDLFIEVPVKKDVEQMERELELIGSSNLHLLARRFYNCMTLKSPRKCENNLRVHYVDFRRHTTTPEEDKELENAMRHFADNKFIVNAVGKRMLELMKSPKLDKQVSNIRDPVLRMAAKFVLFSTTQQFQAALNMFDYYLEQDMDDEEFNVSSYIAAASRVLEFVMKTMDFYATLRMLRSFGEYDSKNIIFIGGELHSDGVVAILKEIAQTMLIQSLSPREQAMVMFKMMSGQTIDNPALQVEIQLKTEQMCLDFDAAEIFA